MSESEKLARAVLMFLETAHERWSADRRAEWLELTGRPRPTARALADLARAVLQAGEVRHERG